MAVPKRRMSRSRTRHRRSQWRAARPALTRITIDGQSYLLPGRLIRAARNGHLDVSKLPPEDRR